MKQSNNNFVYHGSPVPNLKTIKPKVSTHGEKYLYATKHKILALLFLQKWNDFIFNVAYGNDGILEITERYKDALDEIYKDKSGFIYTLEAENFMQDKTRFEGELVSYHEENVISTEKIDNILKSILESEHKKEIRIYRYPNRHPDIPADDTDLVEEAKYFYKKGQKNIIDYCLKLHPHLKRFFDDDSL